MAKRVCIVCGKRENIDDMKIVSGASEKNRYACNGWFKNCASSYQNDLLEEQKSREDAKKKERVNRELNRAILEMRATARAHLVVYKELASRINDVNSFISASRDYYFSIDAFEKSTDVSIVESALTRFKELKLEIREEILYVKEHIFIPSVGKNRTKKAYEKLINELNDNFDDIFKSQSELDLKVKINNLDEHIEDTLRSLKSEVSKDLSIDQFMLITENYLDDFRTQEADFEDNDSEDIQDRLFKFYAEIKTVLDDKWSKICEQKSSLQPDTSQDTSPTAYKSLFLSEKERTFNRKKKEALEACEQMIERIEADRFLIFKSIFPNFLILLYHKMWLYFLVCWALGPITTLAFPFLARKILIRGYNKKRSIIEGSKFSLNPSEPLWKRLINSYIKNTFYGFIVIAGITFIEILLVDNRTIGNTDWDDFFEAIIFYGWVIPVFFRAFTRAFSTVAKDAIESGSEVKDALRKK